MEYETRCCSGRWKLQYTLILWRLRSTLLPRLLENAIPPDSLALTVHCIGKGRKDLQRRLMGAY